MYAVEYAKQRRAFGGDHRRFPRHPVGDRQARRGDRGGAPADLPRRPGWPTRAQFTREWAPYLSMAKYYATEVAVKASGSRGAAARGGRLHEGPPDRALVSRRPAAHDRRGDLAGAAEPDRARCARPPPLVGLSWRWQRRSRRSADGRRYSARSSSGPGPDQPTRRRQPSTTSSRAPRPRPRSRPSSPACAPRASPSRR